MLLYFVCVPNLCAVRMCFKLKFDFQDLDYVSFNLSESCLLASRYNKGNYFLYLCGLLKITEF